MQELPEGSSRVYWLNPFGDNGSDYEGEVERCEDLVVQDRGERLRHAGHSLATVRDAVCTCLAVGLVNPFYGSPHHPLTRKSFLMLAPSGAAFLHGDIVAWAHDALGQSGIVMGLEVQVELDDIHGEHLDSVSTKQLKHIRPFRAGMYVVYKSWVGRVEDVRRRAAPAPLSPRMPTCVLLGIAIPAAVSPCLRTGWIILAAPASKNCTPPVASRSGDRPRDRAVRGRLRVQGPMRRRPAAPEANAAELPPC